MEAEKKPLKMLFVCGRNVDRSPTAEAMFKGFEGLDVKSAGVSVGATVPITKELIDWADAIFVMEFKHQKAVLKIEPKAWRKVESLESPCSRVKFILFIVLLLHVFLLGSLSVAHSLGLC
jgi:predicted protein tyrosine phosphatase